MEISSSGSQASRDCDVRLIGAVEILEAVDRRVGEALRVEAVQDIVGSLLLALSRMRLEGTTSDHSPADSSAELAELIRSCLIMAGLQAHEIEAAISAAAVIEGTVHLPTAAASQPRSDALASNVIPIGRPRRSR